MTMTPLDYYRLLTSPLKDNPIWMDFAISIANVMRDNVDSPRRKMAVIRDPTVTEREYLLQNSKNLGFDFKGEVLSDSDIQRICRFISLFYSQNGTEKFIDFVGFIKDTTFNLAQLWAKTNDDYEYVDMKTVDDVVNPITEPDKITNGGDYFPTSHVQLEYDALNFPIDTSDLTALFYYMAPIHLVLAWIIGVYQFPAANLYWDGWYTETDDHYFFESDVTTGANLEFDGWYTETDDQDQFNSIQAGVETLGLLDFIFIDMVQTPTAPGYVEFPGSNYLNINRNSVGWYDQDSQLRRAFANQFRVDTTDYSNGAIGLLVEGAATNYYDNDNTGAQTIALSAGTYTLKIFNGTAHFVSASEDLILSDTTHTFTISAGNVTITRVSSVQHIQLEDGSFATSQFMTTRTPDLITVKTSYIDNPNNFTVILYGSTAVTTKVYLASFGSSGDRVNIYRLGSDVYYERPFTSQSGVLTTLTTDYIKIGISYDGTDVTFFANGDLSTVTMTGLTLTEFEVGAYNASNFWTGHINQLIVWPKAMNDTLLAIACSFVVPSSDIDFYQIMEIIHNGGHVPRPLTNAQKLLKTRLQFFFENTANFNSF